MITDTSSSPYVKLRSVNIGGVKWTEGFWAERFNVCHQVMIPDMWRTLKDPNISHAYTNFLVAAGLEEGEHKGNPFFDGDFYKWLEAVAYVYGITKDEKLDQRMLVGAGQGLGPRKALYESPGHGRTPVAEKTYDSRIVLTQRGLEPLQEHRALRPDAGARL